MRRLSHPSVPPWRAHERFPARALFTDAQLRADFGVTGNPSRSLE
ncbi:hypothetical protein [Myxococcus vastator]|nr:hypothetical protein [Myxococcus vastator]